MMEEYLKYKRGSEWRKWDLHFHTKGTNKNDQFTQDITGFVTGFNTDSIWLTGQDFPVQIQDIRHIIIS